MDRAWDIVNRAGERAVALETTLLCHGVPRESAWELARELGAIVRGTGAKPALVGVVHGRATVGLDDEELATLLAGEVEKLNTANLGGALFRGRHGATTVATTMELAAAAGVRVFATGGLGGVHRGYGEQLDVSSDLAAFTRFPVAVVTSGVKGLLDVAATREVLETLGVPVVGFGTDVFPAFYLRDGGCGVDIRFDDAGELARFAAAELARTGRGMVVANPIPAETELDASAWRRWLGEAAGRASAEGRTGREVTPRVLELLHEVSGGATLAANLALVRANALLAGRIAAGMPGSRT